MNAPDSTPGRHHDLMAQAEVLYPGVRIGRPGRSRGYWPTVTALRLLRLRYDVDLRGADAVAPGPAFLIGNHTHFLDPVAVVMSTWRKVSAFTKVEWFEHRGAVFFRLMGQIPLRRGDPASTEWAMAMATEALRAGWSIGLYPEGTRSPDPTKLHRLHKRVLIPMLEANPDVPIHAVATRFTPRPRGRTHIRVRISPRLPIDARAMAPDEIVAILRDALLELGGQTYVDVYARDVKAAKRSSAAGAAGAAGAGASEQDSADDD